MPIQQCFCVMTWRDSLLMVQQQVDSMTQQFFFFNHAAISTFVGTDEGAGVGRWGHVLSGRGTPVLFPGKVMLGLLDLQ